MTQQRHFWKPAPRSISRTNGETRPYGVPSLARTALYPPSLSYSSITVQTPTIENESGNSPLKLAQRLQKSDYLDAFAKRGPEANS